MSGSSALHDWFSPRRSAWAPLPCDTSSPGFSPAARRPHERATTTPSNSPSRTATELRPCARCGQNGHIVTQRDEGRIGRRSVNAVTEMIQRTPLASVLPEAIARDHPHLRAVLLDPPLPERTVTLLCRSGSYQSAAARAFTGFLRGCPGLQDFVGGFGDCPW
ncbi:LysR substrate-binding domain-containing protein [Streptomyces sp. NPDC050743]|uniref:LysR substrate-binding domain-containing protein n=1 Tax=Streptomyces sp. NPDC050743 TaxID=3365634 RepID=UPI0037B175A8